MPGRKRANGPYKQGNRWRAVLSPTPSDGSSRYRPFDTERECQEYIDAFNAETGDRTIGQAVSEYLAHLARYGFKRNRPLKPASVTRTRYHLIAIFRLNEVDRNLKAVNATAAQKLYAELVGSGVRTDTHRGSLAAALQFFRWCVAQGWLRVNPFEGVKPEGERSQGKPVLKHDDARRFLDVALGERTVEGLAAATILLLGLRVSELTDRIVDDFNHSPYLLNVPKGKTRAAKRLLSLPAPLGPLIAAHVEGKERNEPLFKLSRYAVYHHVKRFCRAANVPVVCVHGLRGSAATDIVGDTITEDDRGGHCVVDGNVRTQAVEERIEAAARRLGHETSAVTKAHYIAPGTIESATASVKARLLVGNGLETASGKEFPIVVEVVGELLN